MPLYGKIVVIKRTGADGYNFPLTSSSCLFGRKTDCDIRIQLPHVSKEHCKLEVNENNEVILTNLSEVNRTHLNGNVVLHSERLKHRDVFTVIDRSFRFEYPLDSVHNTSPRKRRSLSSLRNETLQEVDDCSQPSGDDLRSTSGHKSAEVNADKIFEAPSKFTKAMPNEKGDSAPKSAQTRSSSKIRKDEQLADEEHVSPFSKLYEMFKQEVTKPNQVKPNKVNTHEHVKESSPDLTEQTSVLEKKSDAMVSQFGKNSQTLPSTIRLPGRKSKVKLEEEKMEKDNPYEKINSLEPLSVDGVASGILAKPTADISSPKQNNTSAKLNKFTNNPATGANATSLASFEVGVNGKDQNHLSPKCTPKAKQKSQHFTTRKSLNVNEAINKIHEDLRFSMEKGTGINVKTVEMEKIPAQGGKERAVTPKKRGRSSLRNQTLQPTEIPADQVESINVSEPSVAKPEDISVDMKEASAHGKNERAETPKKRGRSSLCKQTVQPTEIQADQVESINVAEPSVAPMIEMKEAPAQGGKERAVTPKKHGRSSLCNQTLQPTEIPADQVESVNASELSVAPVIDMKEAPTQGGKERAATPKKRGRSSLRNQTLQPTEIPADQVESVNASELSVAPVIEMKEASTQGGKERAATPKKRGRSSLRNQTLQPTEIPADQVESVNVSELSVAPVIDMKEASTQGGKERAATPKKRGRSSLRNQTLQPTEIPADQVESVNVSELSVAPVIDMKEASTQGGKERAATPKKRGRSSLRNQTLQPTEIPADQVESVNVSELSVAPVIDMKEASTQGGKERAATPKKRGRSSLRNQTLQPTEIPADQVESVNVSEPSVTKSEGISVHMKEASAHGKNEGAENPKKHGRSSLRNKTVQPTETQADQVEPLNVSEPLVAKSPASIKLKSCTTPSSLCMLSNRSKSNCPTEAECLERKNCESNSPHSVLTSEQTEKVVREGLTSPLNTSTERLGQFSAVDIGLDLYTSSKESSSSPGAIFHSSKKRRSENEKNFYAPIFKRKRVSFGANLSPELFDKRMPPSSPLRKGGTPSRVSTPFRCTPRTVLKRASSIGIHTCTIQEFNEQNENCRISPRTSHIPSEDSSRQTKKPSAKISSPGKVSLLTPAKKSPVKRSPLVKAPTSSKKAPLSTIKPSLSSIKKSPAARTPSQSKSPSFITKKSSDVKALLTPSPGQLVSNELPSLLDERSFDCSPRMCGRFSVSHVANPLLSQSKSHCFTPTSRDVALFEKPQEKAAPVASAGKNPSRKSTRRSGSLLAAAHTRRRTGASAANLLMKKSWAQIVKEGVAKPQLQCARKKSAAVQKRTKNTVPLKETPVRSVKGHFSTGHAASPATIVIGKSQATTFKPTGHVPWAIRTVSLRCKDYKMDESFSGMAEMFSTPTNVNTQPVLSTSDIDNNSDTALANPITHKSFEDSIIKTPEETGVMVVSPLTTPGPSSGKYNNSVSRLLRCRVDFSSGLNDLCKNIPKIKGKPVEDMVGVKRIMKTPETRSQPVEDMLDVKRILRTPRVKGKPVKDMVGIKRIMKSPKVKSKPVEDMVGIKRIMKSPKVKSKPVEDMAGIKRIMRTPRVKGKPVEDMVGIKRIMKSPKVKSKPVEDMAGIKRIMRTPRVKGKPVEDMVGIKRIMKSPKVKSKPVEDMVGIKRIMRTPRVKGKPVENFAGLCQLMTETRQKAESPEFNYVGIKNLFHTVKEMENCDYTGLDEMFSTAITTENSPDSKLQPSLRTSANKEATNKLPAPLENMIIDKQLIETTENKLSQIVEQHNELQSTTKNSHRQMSGNSSLTSDDKVSRRGQFQAKSVTSLSSKEQQMQQPEQFETFQMFPEGKNVGYSERQTAESKDEQVTLNKLISPSRTSLRGKKKTQEIGAEECITTMNTTPNKSGYLVEYTGEVNKMVSTRKSLGKKKSNDVDVEMSLGLNETRPVENDSHCEQIEGVTVVKPQRRSLKETNEIQQVEPEELSASTKGKKLNNLQITDVKMSFRPNKTMPGEKESSQEQIEEITVLKPQTRRLLKEMKEIPQIEPKELSASTKRKKILNIQDADVKMSLRSSKTTVGTREARHDQIEEVTVLKQEVSSLNEKDEIQNFSNVQLKELPSSIVKNTTPIKNDSPRKTGKLNKLFTPSTTSLRGKKTVQNTNSTENKTAAQNVQDSELTDPSTSVKTCRKDKRQIPQRQVREMMHKNSGKRLQRRKMETENIQITELKKSPAAKSLKGEMKTQYIQNEKLDSSPLSLMMQETSNIQNVELAITTNGRASSKTFVKDKEVKILPVENQKVLITKGRSQRRKNINVKETEGQQQLGTADGYTRKRGTRCARVEILKDSNGLQGNLRNEAVDNGKRVNLENVKLVEKNLTCSRSTRRKRGPQDLLLEDVGQNSVPAKKLRKEELDAALLRKCVHWDSKIASPKLGGTVEILQDTISKIDLPVLERRSRRGKAAKEEVNPQASLGPIKIPGKAVPEHASNKVIADVCVFPESPEQKGRAKRNKIGVLCESKSFSKDKYENVHDEMPVMKKTNQQTESVLKPTPTSTRRPLRGKARQEVCQIEEENVKELSPRKSKRNTAMQKIMTSNDEVPYVQVSGLSGKKEKRKMTTALSKTKVKDVQVKDSVVECEAIPKHIQQQQPNTATDNFQLDTAGKQVLLQENEPIAPSFKGKRQRAKISLKENVACLANVDIAVGEAVQGNRAYLNAPVIGNELVDDSNIPGIIEAPKQTANKGEIINKAAKAFKAMTTAKKTDTVLSYECDIKGNTRPKRSVRKGRFSKEIEAKIEVENAGLETAEQLNLSKKDSKESTQTEEGVQKKKTSDKKLFEPAINVISKMKTVKKDVPSVLQALSHEGPHIEDPVKVLRKRGHEMVKRSTSAVIGQELNTDATGKRQVIVNSATTAEKTKRTRRDNETVHTIVQVEKNELIDKRKRRPNFEVQTNGAKDIQSKKGELEDKDKEQDPSFLLVEPAKPARRVTRANKSSQPAGTEPISDHSPTGASLQPASLSSSKRTVRGKRAIAETTNLSPKKSKIETVTGKVRTQGRKIQKGDASTKTELAAISQPTKPTGRSTRSRK
ncbi:proliferation marker protein Ki-67 isoform X2 [Stegostoma tigrinum]|uniref:proliferation marker protein Ki-67 isoform X2 n=1 Tax=Stegostoma tigrinum TaxID=3053191 RepID=UPI00287067C3|nr:proliferation marker protein Ki-67 isoform X2 [Stegostoma tigrinum]